MSRRSRSVRGFSLVEIIISLVILALSALFLAKGNMFLHKQGVENDDRAFAIQKCIQMMEELRGLASSMDSASLTSLDQYDDGNTRKTVLTTKPGVSAGDALSGNPDLKFERHVNIIRDPADALTRRVQIFVYRKSNGDVLAQTAGVLRCLGDDPVPTQVYDIFFLDLENIPRRAIFLQDYPNQSVIQSALSELQSRNTGLELQAHFITQLAYGRDPFYAPYEEASNATPSVYFFKAFGESVFTGRYNKDGVVTNGAGHSVVDEFNNGVRYPDELNLYNQDVVAAQAAGTAAPEPTLRILLERLSSGYAPYKNIVIVNCHEGMIICPPMRNYSDPAKEPAGSPDVRAVTHPEKLHYAAGDQVNLRVYTYVMNPNAHGALEVVPDVTIALDALVSASLSIRMLAGNNSTPYQWQDAAAGTDYDVATVGGRTVVTLHNSPLRHPSAPDNTGLAAAKRLEGLEYIPCPVGTGGSPTTFVEGQKDLTAAGAGLSKNTARWVIQAAAGALNGQVTIETRIGTDLTAGSAGNQPTNLSRTYVWAGPTPPVTEQFQFFGDPRHMPYSDVKASHGYNWDFIGVPGGDYEGYTKTTDGWAATVSFPDTAHPTTQRVNFDVGRYFSLYRNALMTENAVYGDFMMDTISQFASYVFTGNDIYANINIYGPSSVINETPYVPNSAATNVPASEATGLYPMSGQTATHYNSRLVARTDNAWFSRPWLGELYPDADYAAWSANGNLPVGPGNYYRALYSVFFSTLGYAAPLDFMKQTGTYGNGAFFNGNPGGAGNNYFFSGYWDGVSLNSCTGYSYTYTKGTATGEAVGSAVNYPYGMKSTSHGGFNINYSSTTLPPAYADAIYASDRTKTTLVESYEKNDTASTYYCTAQESAFPDVVGLVRMENPSNAAQTAHVLVNQTEGEENSWFITPIAQTIYMHLWSFLKAGSPGVPAAGRAQPIPLLTVTAPQPGEAISNPGALTVDWSVAWRRWDGQAYTPDYPLGFTNGDPVAYNLKYSADNGETWMFVEDDAAAQQGVQSASHLESPPYTWNAGALPDGNYLLQVEGYRNAGPGYVYHLRRFRIKR